MLGAAAAAWPSSVVGPLCLIGYRLSRLFSLMGFREDARHYALTVVMTYSLGRLQVGPGAHHHHQAPSASSRRSASQAARCTADHGSRAQPVPTIGVSECA